MATESNFFILKGKRLLKWNKENLTNRSNLNINDSGKIVHWQEVYAIR